MGLKCSLLGHAFDETTTEEDRTESGNEVVHVERTIETCSRCGETRVVSENKEVTAIETGESDASAPDPTESSPSPPPATDTEQPSDPMGGDQFEPPTSAAEDDGIILDDEDDTDDDADRSPGEWPDDDADRSPGEWPDDEPTVEAGEDAEIMTGESDDGDSSEGRDLDDTEAVSETDQAFDDTENAESEPATTATASTFRCPECGFTTDADGASLRAGDYCPDCHTGTLEEAGTR